MVLFRVIGATLGCSMGFVFPGVIGVRLLDGPMRTAAAAFATAEAACNSSGGHSGFEMMMSLFMMWMAGNELHIFPIIITGQAIYATKPQGAGKQEDPIQ
eukprot:gene26309-240_t